MKTKVMMILGLLLLFSGCSQKQVFIKSPCAQFPIPEIPKKQTFSIKKKDVKLYKAYINEFREKLYYSKFVIKMMNEQCKDRQ